MMPREQAESIPFSPVAGQGRSPAMPASIVPQKRKSGPQAKFYAVRVGHTPGVYLTWKECEQSIKGFKNASFKSFLTREEAEAYLAGREASSRVTQSSPQIEKFYGVARGRVPGVYTDWATAQEQIVGWKGPKYKKFATKAEAEEFVRSDSVSSAMVGDIVNDETPIIHDAKRVRVAVTSNEGSAKLGDDQKTGLEMDYLDPVDPMDTTNSNSKEVLRVYTDGSSLSNGHKGARAGFGVYFGPGDPRNVGERLSGTHQTNQRAELAAIMRALEIAPMDREVHVVTDSKYSIDCITVWCKNWERNGWQTSVKQPVLNKDLIQGVLAKIRDREALGTATRFLWVKGHSNEPGNEAADRLAILGAQKPSVG